MDHRTIFHVRVGLAQARPNNLSSRCTKCYSCLHNNYACLPVLVNNLHGKLKIANNVRKTAKAICPRLYLSQNYISASQ